MNIWEKERKDEELYMKQRMINTFFRITKNAVIAKIMASVCYIILSGVYAVYKLFLKKKSDLVLEDAEEILNECSKKPQMFSEINNRDSEIDLSIIVPAYNAESTIEKCVESVIQQKVSFQYELIIINDGSTDNTKEIIKKYEDSHIKLINQENRGFSGARNRGIDEAVGRYLMFLDSDDYLIGNCIQKMMETMKEEDADVVQGSYFSFDEEKGTKQLSNLKKRIVVDEPRKLVANPGYPWAKIFKKELFDNLRFPLDVWFEDTIVCMILYRLSKKIVVMDEIVYAYRINYNGITQKARHNKKCVDHYWVMEFILDKSYELKLPNDELQYEMVKSHMSTLLYRRISLMDEKVIESAFIMASEMLDKIRPDNYKCEGNFIQKDIEKAFVEKKYGLWKAASFVV